jgi:MOSC domain-containing protein YiiM
MNAIGVVSSVHVGRIAPLGPDDVPSGFVKTSIDGEARVGLLGIEGDEQADLTVHGGPEKAVYAYALSNYPLWRADFPDLAPNFGAGSVGENLAVKGLAEADLCVGDAHAIGSVLLQVCQPRQPCFKFALRFEDQRLPAAMRLNGRSGWYYRVLQEGVLKADDELILHDRPHPEFKFTRLLEAITRRNASREEAAAYAKLDGLASQWREHFAERAALSR